MNRNLNQGLDEIFKCVICYDKLLDAKMCPFCSKLFCKVCIRKWLIETRPQCPHCRSCLRMENIVPCRFVKEINQALESLTLTSQDTTEKCPSHDCPLNYYCMNCKSAVCSDCAMFSTDHKDHEFKHLSAIYTQHMEQIEVEANTLKKRISELEVLKKEFDSKIEKISVASNEKKTELSLFIDQAKTRLDEQLSQILGSLSRKNKIVVEEISKLESIQDDIEREKGLAGKSKLISKSSDLVNKLKNCQNLNLDNLEIGSLDFEFESEVIPRYESSIFVLKDYSSAREASEVVYSENLEYFGLIWRLKVYPNGNGVAKNNYLSIFLELVKGYGESSKYDYKVEMMNLDPSRTVLREFSSEFEQGECWGYNRFYRIDLLKEEGYLDETDTLQLKFYVRAPTYYQLTRDQGHLIQSLKDKESASKKKIEDFMERLEGLGVKLEEEKEEEYKRFLLSPEEVSSDSEHSVEWQTFEGFTNNEEGSLG